MPPTRLSILLTGLCLLLLNASPIADLQLEKDLNRYFDAYQLERQDPIEYIDRFEELVEQEYDLKNKAGQVFRIRFIDVKFFVKTSRGAEENFIVRTRYFIKAKKWTLLNHARLKHVQTQEPSIKPSREKEPDGQLVLNLIATKLKEESNPAVTYHIHKIALDGKPHFVWDKSYSISRFRFPIASKVYTVGRIPSDKEFFACNWITVVEFKQTGKEWQIHILDQSGGPGAIVRACVKLSQNTEEKIEDLFPGEGKTKSH